jgi:molybdenum-dependent DNA-binding transcriptional regulator ModE
MKRSYHKKGDQELLLALACGASVESAARKAGVSVRTAYRRLENPQFRQRLQALRTSMVQRAAGTLIAAGLEATKTLLALLQPPNTGAVRLGAARTVLEVGVKMREVSDLEERLANLEQDTAARRTNAARWTQRCPLPPG